MEKNTAQCDTNDSFYALRVKNLSLSRGGVPICAPISFDVPQGAGVRVQGPNGCGKTTLLLRLAGALRSQMQVSAPFTNLFHDTELLDCAQRVLPVHKKYEKHDESGPSTPARHGRSADEKLPSELCRADALSILDEERIQRYVPHFFLPQEYALWGDGSAFENLCFFCAKFDKNVSVRKHLTQSDPFQILPFLHRRVNTLSNGQKRRISLTRLLFTKAPLWLLDEPDQGLDRAFQTVLHTHIEQHLARGGSAVMATHQMAPVSSSTSMWHVMRMHKEGFV